MSTTNLKNIKNITTIQILPVTICFAISQIIYIVIPLFFCAILTFFITQL